MNRNEVRRLLKRCDILCDISRLQRKRAHLFGKDLGHENSDVVRFKKQLRKPPEADEDFAQFMMLLYNHDKYSQPCKGGEESSIVVRDRPNHDEDEEEDKDKDEDEDEDEDDQEYLKFLSNAKPDGRSYVLKIDTDEGFPLFIKYEKEEGSDDEYEHLGGRKQQNARDQKDFRYDSSKDEVESQTFSSTVPESDNDSSAGDDNLILEPLDPVSHKKNGSFKRHQKDERKNRSNMRQTMEKGRKRESDVEEKGADADEEYPSLLANFIRKTWHLRPKAPFVRKHTAKRQPYHRVSPKEKKKRGRPCKNRSMKENDASKGVKRRRSSKKQTEQKRRKLAHITVEEVVAGSELAIVPVKEEVDETPIQHFECQASEEILRILDKEGSSNLVKASSEKHNASVEGSCPTNAMHSDFRSNADALLKKPYDEKEYGRLLKAVKKRKPIERNMDLRNGGISYPTKQLGKSYLDHYRDLRERLKKVGDDKRKKLYILRGFFHWLQNLTQEEAFKPWTDREWLSLVANQPGQSGEKSY